MAHPSDLIPKNPHLINGDVTATLSSGAFHTVTCIADNNSPGVSVKGGGIFVYLGSGVSGAGYFDPTTGEEFTGNTTAAGFYEALPTTAVSISLPATMSIYGYITEVDSATGHQYIGYK